MLNDQIILKTISMTAQWQRYGQDVRYFIVKVILTFLFKGGGGHKLSLIKLLKCITSDTHQKCF